MQKFASATALACVLAILALAPVSSHAADVAQGIKMSGTMSRPSGATLIQYGYCANWYRICRYRWGYGYPFRRCLAIRGCL